MLDTWFIPREYSSSLIFAAADAPKISLFFIYFLGNTCANYLLAATVPELKELISFLR